MTTKEEWDSLTDEEKTEELKRIIPGADYKKYKETYENFYKERGNYMEFENPVLVLKLVDPVMTYMIGQWMYCKGKKVKTIPVFGYALEKIAFNAAALSGFSDEEKYVLFKAMEILSNKVN